MTKQWLLEHMTKLSEQLARFEQAHEQLHLVYQQACVNIQSQEALSNLTEAYAISLNRQQKAIDTMTGLYQKAHNRLVALESAPS